ncbi:MAG: TIGR03619 family F420-dependent LLM class oxidoreductase [Pseudomonadales bacterium]
MRYGIALPNNQGVARMAQLLELAVAAEAMQFDSLWVSEHLFHASYVAQRLGGRPYHEPLTLLAAVAAQTRQIRLGTSVLVLPWHHPVRLAKTLAAIDDLSEGRLLVGVGVAQTEDEFANLGVDFHRRGRIADETLGALKALWTMDVPEFSGEHYRFAGLRVEPKPRQKPHPPLLIGGNSAAAIRRLQRYGDGWHPLSLAPAQIAERSPGIGAQVPIVVRAVTEIAAQPWERPVAERRTFKGTAAELRAMIAAYRAAGVTDLVIDANTADIDATLALWRRLREEVLI